MSAYRKITHFGIAFIGLYLLLALIGTFTSKGEIFPCFNWILFPTIPNAERVYNIQLLKHQGESFSTPVRDDSLQNRLLRPHSIDFYATVQQLGIATTQSNLEKRQLALETLSSQFLPPPYTIQLVEKQYHPIQAWNGEESEVILIDTIQR